MLIVPEGEGEKMPGVLVLGVATILTPPESDHRVILSGQGEAAAK
jgi:hypothetical protein